MILFEPIGPWSYIAFTGSLLAIILILLRGILDRLNRKTPWLILGGSRLTRKSVLVFSLLAAFLFALAALNPHWTDAPNRDGFHLQIAVDVSESVLRAQGGWDRIRRKAYERIRAAIDATPVGLRGKCSGGILTFRKQTNEANDEKPFKELAEAFIKLEQNQFAGGEGTDIQKGLEQAAQLLHKAGGQGAILLISDGNQTAGKAIIAAQQLARQGVPVHVFPVTSRGPAVAITDADLPRMTHTNAQTFVRGMMLNRLKQDKDADLKLSKDPGQRSNKIDKNINGPSGASRKISLPTGKWVRFRWPVIFDSFGLQYIDLTLTPFKEASANQPEESHRRRFYTYVKRPPQILAIGGDNRWIAAIPGDVAEIIPIKPHDLITSRDLKEIDAVVISGVPAHALPMSSMMAIYHAVERDGKGLLLVNGGHQGATSEMETVLMSYVKTPLQKLLPVVGGPRPFMDEPPMRQVVILIDTSGSMGGWKLRKSREIAKYIVKTQLRPRDRLDLITFTYGAGHLLRDRIMDEEGKRIALSRLDMMRAGGGTDPNRALALIGSRQMKQCGMIFISDGEFANINYRPDCRVTVFEIGGSRYSRSQAMKKLADPIPVSQNFDPKSIKIPYFEPEEREKFFEDDVFSPLSMERHLPKHLRIPVPELELKGSAVSYLNEGGILIGVRPKLIDPILALGQTGEGYVAVFTSELSGKWLLNPEAQKALEAWLGRLVPFMERDRYDFVLEDYGDSIDIRISLVAKRGKLPDVSAMSAVVQFLDGEFSGVALRTDETIPGNFIGEIRTGRKPYARKAILSLRESGPDAVPRAQRIPIIIPAKGGVNASPTAEAYTYGQNRQLLRKISNISGGKFNPPKDSPFFQQKPATDQGYPLWPLLAVIAVFCYLTAIALRRFNP